MADRREDAVRFGDRLKQPLSRLGVLHHLAELTLVQRTGLGQDAVGDDDHAEIVEESRLV